MYVLTIFKNVRKGKKEKTKVIDRIETFEPPNEQTIQDALDSAGSGASFDIHRRELEPEDFEYREEF